MGFVNGTTSDSGTGLDSPSGAGFGQIAAVAGNLEPALPSRLGGIGSDRMRLRRSAPDLSFINAAALMRALRAHDSYTASHSNTVVDLALRVARALRVPADQLPDIARTALLHDVGKIAIPDFVLTKPGPLSEAEWQAMKLHTEIGERLVDSVPSLKNLAAWIRAAHERWDGLGYPDGLRGEEIPLASRIVFVCDAYDAMTSDRSYRRALPKWAAVRELADNAGTQFCPTSVEALLTAVAPFLRGPVQHGSRRRRFQRQPEEGRGIQPVHRGPAVGAVADVAGDTFGAGGGDQLRDETVIAFAVH